MKQIIYCVAVFMIAAFNVPAQDITKTPVSFKPYTSYSLDTSGVSEGQAGKNVTWDFSSIKVKGSEIQRNLPKDSCPGASNFTNANYALNIPSLHMYQFYDSVSTSRVGIYRDEATPTIIIYTDPIKLANFPYTYGDTLTDHFEGTYQGPFGKAKRTGTYKKQADAAGTIVTPYGTYKKALRIKSVETILDEFEDGKKVETVNTFYYWLVPGQQGHVFGIYIGKTKNQFTKADMNSFKSVTSNVYK